MNHQANPLWLGVGKLTLQVPVTIPSEMNLTEGTDQLGSGIDWSVV